MTPVQDLPARLHSCASLASLALDVAPRTAQAPLTQADLILAAFDALPCSLPLPLLQARYRVERALKDCQIEFRERDLPRLRSAVRDLQTACFAFEDRWKETFIPLARHGQAPAGQVAA